MSSRRPRGRESSSHHHRSHRLDSHDSHEMTTFPPPPQSSPNHPRRPPSAHIINMTDNTANPPPYTESSSSDEESLSPSLSSSSPRIKPRLRWLFLATLNRFVQCITLFATNRGIYNYADNNIARLHRGLATAVIADILGHTFIIMCFVLPLLADLKAEPFRVGVDTIMHATPILFRLSCFSSFVVWGFALLCNYGLTISVGLDLSCLSDLGGYNGTYPAVYNGSSLMPLNGSLEGVYNFTR